MVLTDIRMSGAGGFEILKKTLSLQDPSPCILLTSCGPIETAVEAKNVARAAIGAAHFTLDGRKLSSRS